MILPYPSFSAGYDQVNSLSLGYLFKSTPYFGSNGSKSPTEEDIILLEIDDIIVNFLKMYLKVQVIFYPILLCIMVTSLCFLTVNGPMDGIVLQGPIRVNHKTVSTLQLVDLFSAFVKVHSVMHLLLQNK